MFNLSGSEVIFLIIIALVVLGPDKLPDAMRKAGKAYADFKKLTSGFQSEMKSVLDEPMRELRETAELAKRSAMFDFNAMDPKPDSQAQQPTQQPQAQAIVPPVVESPMVEPIVAEPPEPDAGLAPQPDAGMKPVSFNMNDHMPPIDNAAKRAEAQASSFEARNGTPPAAATSPDLPAVDDSEPSNDTASGAATE